MPDYQGAIELLNSNAFPGRYGWKPQWIILHGTAGGSSAQGIAQYFKNTEGSDNPVSATYVADQAGIIYQCNRESEGAWANGVVTAGHDPWWSDSNNPNPNNVTISIEHVKPDTANATALTPAQQAASFALIKDICQRNGIPMRLADANGGIIGHYSIDPVNRARCPGPYPWSELWAYLKGETHPMAITLSTPGVSSFFTGDSKTWTCKQNGFTLHGEILAFYQQFGGSGLCGLTHLGLPTSNELPVDGHPGVVDQEFERGAARFDPDHALDGPPGAGRVYIIHQDQDPRVVSLHAQIATLEKQVAGQTPPQALIDDIAILEGNLEKLKSDAGARP